MVQTAIEQQREKEISLICPFKYNQKVLKIVCEIRTASFNLSAVFKKIYRNVEEKVQLNLIEENLCVKTKNRMTSCHSFRVTVPKLNKHPPTT